MSIRDRLGEIRDTHAREPGPTISRNVGASAEDVWSVLADGWTYANWVVGAARIREVDQRWPATGSKIHHSFGLWPALIHDSTRVESSTPTTDLVLIARGWPAGESKVHITVEPKGVDSSEVVITEDAVSGPARLVPPFIRHALFVPRNRETLHRLALIAEGRRRLSAAR
jgi:hypothetical protein